MNLARGCLAVLVLSVVACGESGRVPLDAGPGSDATTEDAQTDAGQGDDAALELDAGQPDSGPAPDASPLDASMPDSGPAPDGAVSDSGSAVDASPLDAGVPDSGPMPDATLPDLGMPFPDGGLPNDGSLPDLGIPSPDGGFLNDGSLPDLGIPFPDGGFLNDGSLPDLGIPFPDGGLLNDGGLPDLGIMLPDGGVATTVTVLQANAYLNLMPAVPADPLIVQVDLQINNPGNTPETLTVTDASLIGLSLQSVFTVNVMGGGTSIVAPPGQSQDQLTKVAGSGSPLTMPQSACGTPAFLVINIAGVLPLTTPVTIACVF